MTVLDSDDLDVHLNILSEFGAKFGQEESGNINVTGDWR